MNDGHYIVIYDNTGTIITINPVEDNKLPVGIPYIEIHGYDPERAKRSGCIISHVDLSFDPPQLVFKNPREEKRVEEMTLDEYKDARQEQNKYSLESFLRERYVDWEDLHRYSVSQEAQQEMLHMKSIHAVNPNYPLRWWSIDAGYKDFTEDEFNRLLDKIIAYVYPYRQLEMIHKSRIYAAETKEQVAEVPVVYMEPIDEEFLRKFKD